MCIRTSYLTELQRANYISISKTYIQHGTFVKTIPKAFFQNCLDIRELLSIVEVRESFPTRDRVDFGLSTTLSIRIH